MDDEAAGALPERADAEGGDRQRLDDRPPGAASRRRRASRPTCATSWPRRSRRSSTARSTTTSWRSRGFGVIYAGPGRLRQVHGQVRRRPRRDDEGGRASPSKRTHETQRRGLRARCCVAARRASSSWHIQGFPAIPGQKVGPALFPGLIAAGLCVCGALLDRARPARARAGARRWLGVGRVGALAARTSRAFACSSAVDVFYILVVDALGFCLTGVAAPAALLLRAARCAAARRPCRSRSSPTLVDPLRLLQAAARAAAVGRAASAFAW